MNRTRFPSHATLRATLLAGALGVASMHGAGAASAASGASPTVLDELSPADIEAVLMPGELACGFSVDSNALIFLARGDVASSEDATGIVKANGSVTLLTTPGGFDAMIGGARFSGEGVVVTINVTGEAAAEGESPPSPATLAFEAADGKAGEIAGQWTCGP